LRSSRATVSPPTPESKRPIGRLSIFLLLLKYLIQILSYPKSVFFNIMDTLFMMIKANAERV
ncbi:MAG: hypothetical protein ACTIOE_10550, partial [Lactococcus lactis]